MHGKKKFRLACQKLETWVESDRIGYPDYHLLFLDTFPLETTKASQKARSSTDQKLADWSQLVSNLVSGAEKVLKINSNYQ